MNRITAPLRRGWRSFGWGFATSVVPLLVWQFTNPAWTGLTKHPVAWLLVAAVLAMSVWVRRLSLDAVHGYLPLAGGFGVLALLAVWREVVRMHHLAPFGYDITSYTVHVDWPSTLLFFSTFIGVGGLVGGFYLTTIYQAGRTQGLYTADKTVARLGSSAVGILAVWIAVFLVYGIAIWVKNSFV